MTLKNEEKSEEKLTCCFKNWYKEFDEFWLKNLKISNIYTLMDCFWPNYIIFELKKYKGAIFCDTRVWCKIWRKTDLWFGKWHEEFGKFSPEHTKFSKFQLSLDLFIQSRKCTKLKLKGELCVTAMKNDAKFEVELTCQFKIDMRNLTNFHMSTFERLWWDPFIQSRKCKSSKFAGEFCATAMKNDPKFKEELTC